MSEYVIDRAWSDARIQKAMNILYWHVGKHTLQIAPYDQDVLCATDLNLKTSAGLNIACRLRRPGYVNRYPFDVTIRCSRPSGVKTEYDKIYAGHGNWMFYGHEDDDGDVTHWMIISLDRFREHLYTNWINVEPSASLKWNRDDTGFIVFNVRTFPAVPNSILIGCSDRFRHEWITRK